MQRKIKGGEGFLVEIGWMFSTRLAIYVGYVSAKNRAALPKESNTVSMMFLSEKSQICFLI